jgi:hypothetical protein
VRELQAAIDAMLPALRAASEATHELEPVNKEEAHFERVVQMGFSMSGIDSLCDAWVRLLSDLLYTLIKLELGEHETGEEAREIVH